MAIRKFASAVGAKLAELFWLYQFPLLAGVLIGFSYIPFPPWASVFAFVPLWWFWLKAKNWKQVFFAGWLTQFMFTVIGFDWVLHTIHEFGMMPWWISALGFAGFCSFANLDVAIAGLLWWFLARKFLRLEVNNRNLALHLILLAICTLFAKDFFPTIFLWNYGYPFLWIHWPMAQCAELIGFQGISDIIILLNGLSYLAIFHWREKAGRRAAFAIVAAMAFLNLAGYGLLKSLPKPNAKANVLVVQANIGDIEKIYAEHGWGYRDFIFAKYRQMTEQGLAEAKSKNLPIDFVVWPETSYPYEMDQRSWQNEPIYPPGARQLLNLTASWSTQLLVGGYGFSPRDGKPTNTFFIAQSDGKMQPDPYYKTYLLAFGEYIPFGDWFPKLYEWIPAGNFSRGPGPQVRDVPLIPKGTHLIIGPEICYEGLFHDFAKKQADKGAEIFVNINNDSWFGDWQEPYQNLYNTMARTVEFRRPMVRSTNTGISAVMLADGTMVHPSPIYKSWYGIYQIPYRIHPEPTFYQRFPQLLHVLFVLLLGVLIVRRGFSSEPPSEPPQ